MPPRRPAGNGLAHSFPARPELPTMTIRAAAPLALALSLAACAAPGRDEFPPVCPVVRGLPTAQDLAMYRPGGGRDLTDVQLEGSILAAQGKCQQGGSPRIVDTTLAIQMRFQRGPAAPTRQANIRYFVAVARGDDILNKRVFVVPVVFPPNVDAVTITTQPVELLLPVGKDRSAAGYTIWVGFQK
jgi:hypothetical protein